MLPSMLILVSLVRTCASSMLAGSSAVQLFQHLRALELLHRHTENVVLIPDSILRR